MAVKFLNFSELRKAIGEKKIEFVDFFVEKFGIAYVVAVTREKCSGCEKQETLYEKLSDKMKSKHGSRVEFARVHAYFSQESKEETMQCLDTFHTVAFPTYVICVRNHQGKNRETYRAIAPPMHACMRHPWMKSKEM